MAKFKASVRNVWLLSYVVILLIPIVIGAFSFVQAYDTVKSETIQYNMDSINMIKQNIDEKISRMYEIQTAVLLSQRISNLTRAEQLDSDIQYLLYEAMREIKLYFTDAAFQSFIYFEKIDSVVSGDSIHGLRTFYDIYYNKTADYSQFVQGLSRIRSNDYTVQVNNNGDIMFTLPVTRGTYMFFIVSGNYISQMVAGNYLTREGILLMLDSNNDLLFTSAPVEGMDMQKLTAERRKAVSDFAFNGSKYSVIDLATKNINYIFLVPKRLFMQKIVGVQTIFIWSVILIVVVGSVSIIMLIKTNYKPVQGLIETIEAGGEGENEFTVISRSIHTLADKNKEMEMRFSKSEPIVRSSVITNLLRGKTMNQDILQPILEEAGLAADGTCFIVLTFSVSDYGIFDDEQLEESSNDDLQTFSNCIISNVVGELIEENNKNIFSEIDEELACIVNVREENCRVIGQQLHDALNKAQSFIQENFGIAFFVGIGRLQQGLAGIAQSYNEAVEAVEYSRLTNAGSLVYFADIKPPERYEYYYSNAREETFINLIRSGSYDEARLYMNRMLDDYLNQPGMSVNIIKCFVYDIAGTLLKTYLEMGSGEEFDKDFGSLDTMFVGSDIERIRLHLEELLQTVCGRILRNSDRTTVSHQVKTYIDSHYMEPNLNINSIGDQLGFVPSYLSKMFKDAYGDNMLNYINMTRMEQAKKLLLSTDGTIDEVANQVGISNKVTFIRLFKKHVGITPGKYREINQG